MYQDFSYGASATFACLALTGRQLVRHHGKDSRGSELFAIFPIVYCKFPVKAHWRSKSLLVLDELLAGAWAVRQSWTRFRQRHWTFAREELLHLGVSSKRIQECI